MKLAQIWYTDRGPWWGSFSKKIFQKFSSKMAELTIPVNFWSFRSANFDLNFANFATLLWKTVFFSWNYGLSSFTMWKNPNNHIFLFQAICISRYPIFARIYPSNALVTGFFSLVTLKFLMKFSQERFTLLIGTILGQKFGLLGCLWGLSFKKLNFALFSLRNALATSLFGPFSAFLWTQQLLVWVIFELET